MRNFELRAATEQEPVILQIGKRNMAMDWSYSVEGEE
jgi:hypothetical protein